GGGHGVSAAGTASGAGVRKVYAYWAGDGGLAGRGACSGCVPVWAYPRAGVRSLPWDDDREQWRVAGSDRLSEEDGIGAAARGLAGGESPILAGAHDGLPVRIESVKDFFCFDIPPGGGREIVSRKRKDNENQEIGRAEKDSESGGAIPSQVYRARSARFQKYSRFLDLSRFQGRY